MGRFERRTNHAQREAVARVLAEAEGETKIVTGRDGSVFVYDEVRHRMPPRTRRTRVLATGETEVPDLLKLS